MWSFPPSRLTKIALKFLEFQGKRFQPPFSFSLKFNKGNSVEFRTEPNDEELEVGEEERAQTKETVALAQLAVRYQQQQ